MWWESKKNYPARLDSTVQHAASAAPPDHNKADNQISKCAKIVDSSLQMFWGWWNPWLPVSKIFAFADMADLWRWQSMG